MANLAGRRGCWLRQNDPSCEFQSWEDCEDCEDCEEHFTSRLDTYVLFMRNSPIQHVVEY